MSELTDVQFVPSDAAMRRAGLRAVAIIRERTLRGLDYQGNPFEDYSTETFAMPAGAISGRAKSALKAGNRISFFKTKAGRLWALVEGGYKALKEARYPQYNGVVNLTATGKMLRSLTIVSIQGDTVTLGFSRQEEAQKAYWLGETGVGKRRTIRKFLGLTDEERAEVALIALDGIAVKT